MLAVGFEAVPIGEHGIEVLASVPDHLIDARRAIPAAQVCRTQGRVALAVAAASAARLSSVARRDPAGEVHALELLAILHMDHGDFRQALVVLRLAEARCREHGLADQLPAIQGELANALMAQGRHQEAP